MLRRTGFHDGYPMRGPQRNFGQRDILGVNQVANAAKLYNHIQLADRESWLLQLGLTRFCAHELAHESIKRPDFNLLDLQQRWKRVCLIMGPNRQAEADALILREMREILHRPAAEIECHRTPSPQPERNWPENRNHSPVPQNEEYCGPAAPDRYLLHGMTSTPLCEENRERRSDPRNMEDTRNFSREPSPDFVPRNLDDNNDARRFNQPDVYNIEEDPRNFPIQQPNHQHYNYNRNNNNNDGVPRNLEENYARQQLPNFPVFNSNEYNNNNQYHDENDFNLNRDFRNDFPHQQQRNYYTNEMRYNDRNNQNNRNNNDRKPYPKEKHYRGFLHNMEVQLSPRNCRADYGSRNTRKRIFNYNNIPLIEQEVPVPSKRRNENQPSKPSWFKIGDFKMPYICEKNDPLPQLESKSYAVKFYERKHDFIIGGRGAIPRDAPEKELPDEKTLANSINLSRRVIKNIRRHLRMAWPNIYHSNNYKNWEFWWKDYKWCEEAIEKKLERYEGIDLTGVLLGNILNYDNEQSAERLLKMAYDNFTTNSNNIQSIMSTIFELMNKKFLEKLTTAEMEKLQNLIRYESNDSWKYKMRSMVFLWARYSQLQKSSDSKNYDKLKYAVVTHAQWNSPLFHWLAKQAYAELKLISQLEWKDHEKEY